MANALHLYDRQLDRHTLNKHQDSIMASLNHRLEVARANHNTNLVALLEQEKQQVALTATSSGTRSANHRSSRNWWNAVTQYITGKLFGGSVLQVAEVVDGNDRWWVACDPRTGQFVYADSEAELRLWIEENYRGK